MLLGMEDQAIPVLLMAILTAYTPYLLGLWELMEFQLIMMKYAQPNLSQHMWKTFVIHYQEWCVYAGHYVDIYVHICLSFGFEDNIQVYIKRLIFCSLQATTNVFGSCADDFGGTSAATPIMSSMVALTLEAK